MFAIIADDLTGAGDAGVQFALAGLPTRTLADDWQSSDLPRFGVAVVDTDTRHLDAASASRRVHAAALRLRAAGAQIVYKKIDSTLRGPIGAEIEAVLDACGGALAVVCPAYPANSRTLEAGRLLVGGAPVAATTAGMDPRAPVWESHLPTLLASQVHRSVHLLPAASSVGGAWLEGALAAIAGPLSPGAIVVCDASSDGDLAAIVAAALALPSVPLLVGSAGLALPLAQRLVARVAQQAPRTVLVLCGSVHDAARAQVRWLAQHGSLNVTVLVTPDPIAGGPAGETNGARPEEHLAQQGAAWLRAQTSNKADASVAGVVVTGGDTLRAFLRTLAARGVDLAREVAPGLPLGYVAGGTWEGLPIVSKAGGFGAPDALAHAAEFLLAYSKTNQERTSGNGG